MEIEWTVKAKGKKKNKPKAEKRNKLNAKGGEAKGYFHMPTYHW